MYRLSVNLRRRSKQSVNSRPRAPSFLYWQASASKKDCEGVELKMHTALNYFIAYDGKIELIG
jgi:hypothetical protein